MTREEIAEKIADEGWCPDSCTERPEYEHGYLITKTMFICDEEIDDYIKEHNIVVLP